MPMVGAGEPGSVPEQPLPSMGGSESSGTAGGGGQGLWALALGHLWGAGLWVESEGHLWQGRGV